MKTLIIIAVLSVWSIAATNRETTNISEANSNLFSPSVIKVKVQIGLGKGGNCRGKGLCGKIEVSSATDEVQPDNQALAMAEYKGNTLTLEFLKSSMTPATINRQFANGEFTIEEDTKLDAGPVSPKNSGKSLLVPKGKYTVEDMGRSFQIALENCMISSY